MIDAPLSTSQCCEPSIPDSVQRYRDVIFCNLFHLFISGQGLSVEFFFVLIDRLYFCQNQNVPAKSQFNVSETRILRTIFPVFSPLFQSCCLALWPFVSSMMLLFFFIFLQVTWLIEKKRMDLSTIPYIELNLFSVALKLRGCVAVFNGTSCLRPRPLRSSSSWSVKQRKIMISIRSSKQTQLKPFNCCCVNCWHFCQDIVLNTFLQKKSSNLWSSNKDQSRELCASDVNYARIVHKEKPLQVSDLPHITKMEIHSSCPAGCATRQADGISTGVAFWWSEDSVPVQKHKASTQGLPGLQAVQCAISGEQPVQGKLFWTPKEDVERKQCNFGVYLRCCLESNQKRYFNLSLFLSLSLSLSLSVCLSICLCPQRISKRQSDYFRLSVLKGISPSVFLQLLKWTRTLIGRRLFRRLMAATIYGQFMAGETQETVLEIVRAHRKYNVLSMFTYTAMETHGYTM